MYFIETKMVTAAEPSNATLFNTTLDSESSWMHWWNFVNTMDPLSTDIIQPIVEEISPPWNATNNLTFATILG